MSKISEYLQFKTRLGHLVLSGEISDEKEIEIIKHLNAAFKYENYSELDSYFSMTNKELIDS